MIFKQPTTNSLKDGILFDCLTLEEGINRQSRNVGNQIPT